MRDFWADIKVEGSYYTTRGGRTYSHFFHTFEVGADTVSDENERVGHGLGVGTRHCTTIIEYYVKQCASVDDRRARCAPDYRLHDLRKLRPGSHLAIAKLPSDR